MPPSGHKHAVLVAVHFMKFVPVVSTYRQRSRERQKNVDRYRGSEFETVYFSDFVFAKLPNGAFFQLSFRFTDPNQGSDTIRNLVS
jgi:hypothetical protein